uniref:Uncharacterized protein n=1 Tax=Triticum urartu TaxID=4572 RepID=A0A8R7Q3R9_TRIUA
ALARRVRREACRRTYVVLVVVAGAWLDIDRRSFREAGGALASMAMGEARGARRLSGTKDGYKGQLSAGRGELLPFSRVLACSGGEERRSKAELGEQSEEFILLRAHAPALRCVRVPVGRRG